MKNLIKILSLVLLLLSTQVFAQAAKPSVNSVKELILLSDASEFLKSYQSNAEDTMKAALKPLMNNAKFSAKQQRILEKFQTKIFGITKETLEWENLEPVFISIYTDTYTQEEVDGMIAFYKTPVGQSYIKKMPVLTEKTMTTMQGVMLVAMNKFTLAGE